MSAPADDVTVHQITCQRCCHTARVGTRLSALEWALAALGWSTTGIGQHTCPECIDAIAAIDRTTPPEDTRPPHPDCANRCQEAEALAEDTLSCVGGCMYRDHPSYRDALNGEAAQ